jgi:hypothetical protein
LWYSATQRYSSRRPPMLSELTQALLRDPPMVAQIGSDVARLVEEDPEVVDEHLSIVVSHENIAAGHGESCCKKFR